MGAHQSLGSLFRRPRWDQGATVGAAKSSIRLVAFAAEVAAAADRFVLRAQSFMWLLLIGIICVGVYQASTDRAPPFRVLEVEPAAARAGEVVTIRQRVVRDLSRPCSVKWSRFMWAPGMGRLDLTTEPVQVGPEFISRMEARDPGRLTVSVRIPDTAQPGQGSLVTHLDYWCKPAQRAWPITVITDVPFTVLP
jgi:hypothetical protein